MIKNNVQIEAWAPFGEGRNDMFNNPTFKKMADKYEKSVAQVILRCITTPLYLYQSTPICNLYYN